MGVFACFQGTPPHAPKRCQSACSTCWGDSLTIDNPHPPDSPLVREHNRVPDHTHDPQVEEIKRDPNPSPTHFIPEPKILFAPRQAAATRRNNFPLRTKFEDRNLPLLLPPPPLRAKPINPSPLPFQHVVQHRNPSPPRQVTEVRESIPPREYSKNRYPSPREQPVDNRNPSKHPNKCVQRRHPSAPPRLARQEDRSEIQELVQDRSPKPPTQSAKHRETSPVRNKASATRPTTRDEVEPGEIEHHILHPRLKPPSPPRNPLPVVFSASTKISPRLKDVSPPPFIRCGKARDTPSDCYSSTPCSTSNVGTFNSLVPIVGHQLEWKSQMESTGVLDHHKHQWVNSDTDHIHKWEEYNSGSDGGQTLAIELHREVARDLAEQKTKGRGIPGSPRSPSSPRSISESCVDSYCSRAENPLRQKTYEPKFPYGTPEVRDISPPGWTYAPKRKNKRGEWWDKDWPKNKRYIYYDPNAQPCGCPLTKKHAGSRTPSPATSARLRGMAYADQAVKINRERSLSPQSKSRTKLVREATSEHQPKRHHDHRHVHLDWSCSNSPRTSSPSPSNPVSRAITPTVSKVINSCTSTSVYSPPRSPASTQLQTPRTNVRISGSISRDQKPEIYSEYRPQRAPPSAGLFPASKPRQPERQQVPSTGGGYSAPLSQSATSPWPLRRQHKPVPNVRNYPDSPCTSSSSKPLSRGRFVTSRGSAPPRQRPDGQDIHIYLSSSSGRSTPCSISVRRKPTFAHQYEDNGRRSREKYVGTMGHCHTPGSWSCTPRDSTPHTPLTPRSLTPSGKSDYTVTITCPPDEDLIDDRTPGSEPELSCNCLCHCPCTQNYIDQGCCNNQFSRTPPRRVIGGPCDWHQVVHHHRPVSHCHCGCCHF